MPRITQIFADTAAGTAALPGATGKPASSPADYIPLLYKEAQSKGREAKKRQAKKREAKKKRTELVEGSPSRDREPDTADPC